MVQIRDGKLFDGNMVVLPQFGNWDHILAIKQAVNELELAEIDSEYDNPGTELSINTITQEINVYASFKCTCGKHLSLDGDYNCDDEDEAIDKFIDAYKDKIKTCSGCKKNYKITCSKDKYGASTLYYKHTTHHRP